MDIIVVMAYEAFPVTAMAPEMAEQPLIDDGYLLDTYGLGPAEMDQVITFGGHVGSFRDAVTDERCPIGGMLAGAFEKDGINGVQRKLHGLQALDESFSVTVSPETMGYHEGKVGRESVLERPASDERTGFLA